MRFTNHHGTEQLLVSLAMGKIDSCPFPLNGAAELKRSVIGAAAGFGHQIVRGSGDRSDVPIDYRFLDLLPRVAEDPERSRRVCAGCQSGTWDEDAEIACTVQAQEEMASCIQGGGPAGLSQAYSRQGRYLAQSLFHPSGLRATGARSDVRSSLARPNHRTE